MEYILLLIFSLIFVEKYGRTCEPMNLVISDGNICLSISF